MKKNDVYVIDDYLNKKSFASFLPGLAGVNGIPLWCFFVNRGQGVSSFGVENKNKSIMEFYPANKALETVNLRGFRTFIKVGGELYEAFSAYSTDCRHSMKIEKNLLTITEHNSRFQINISVSYFILPHEFFGSMVRSVVIENLGELRSFEVVDGMPEVLPSGMDTEIVKNMSFTARAWVDVFNKETAALSYRVRSSIGDTESVKDIEESIFFVSFLNGMINRNIIYDRDILFGNNEDLIYPKLLKNNSLEKILLSRQYSENKYSSAFACINEFIAKNEKLCFQSYIGYSTDKKNFFDIIAHLEREMSSKKYYTRKMGEARDLVNGLINNIYTETKFDMFDQYCKQSYLDNILRGGYPLVIPQKHNKNLVYHVYARKHGDLERDYNFFNLEAKYYSQGNGNFRDICQNRRNDVLFNPEIEDFNVLTFLNLIQIDGYNPYVVKGLTLSIREEDEILSLEQKFDTKISQEFKDSLKNFTIGSLLDFAKNEIDLRVYSIQEIVDSFVFVSEVNRSADFGEGFWIDHFSYHLDLIESFCDIYPEKIKKLLFDTSVSYYDSPARVKTRKEKYVFDEKERKIIQRASLDVSRQKELLIEEKGHTYLVDEHNNIYTATVFEKLLCLISNRIASLDIKGIGIEMEANKPGWNDALNGLPGIVGSCVSELFELLRIVDFLLLQIKNISRDSEIEINKLIYEFSNSLADIFSAGLSEIERWDKSNLEKESFRNQVFYFINGEKINVSVQNVLSILESYKAQLTIGYELLFKNSVKIPPSFIENIIIDYKIEDNQVSVNRIVQRSLPLFLEAPAKSLYVLEKDEARELYKKIKESDIYDSVLKMYKTSESLEGESKHIGRAKSFTPGWLERESVFMHMQFKYLLHILEKGLYEEFYEDLRTAAPCFMDEEVYGRPVSEASSFIVSSVNANKDLHGRGFSARLSGSTAEVLSLWKIMFLGERLFFIDEGELCLSFSPRLHASFFPDDGVVKTTLFSSISVEIHNPKRENIFDTLPKKIECDRKIFEGNILRGDIALSVRNKEVKNIRIYY